MFFVNFRFSKIEISASSPIVPFRETIVPPPTIDMVNESILDQNPAGKNEKRREFDEDEEVLERGLVRIFTPSKTCMVQVCSLPLPQEVTEFLDDNQFLIKTLDQYLSAKISVRHKSDLQLEAKLKHSTTEAIREFKDKLESLFVEAGKQWKGCVDSIWAFGPKRVGPNLLLNKVDGYNRTSMWECLKCAKVDSKVSVREYDYSVVSGFQLATLTGPLCDEPMRGMCFVVEKWKLGSHIFTHDGDDFVNKNTRNSQTGNKISKGEDNRHIHLSGINLVNHVLSSNNQLKADGTNCVKSCLEEDKQIPQCSGTSDIDPAPEPDCDDETECDAATVKKSEVKGHVSGQLISIMKEACQKSFQTQPQRLMAAMYKCNIQATADVLGKYKKSY